MDDSEVLRDVVYTVDGQWRPVDAFVRLTVRDRFMGSGWFRFTDDAAECESFTAATGRLSQRVTTDGRARSFGPHPVACDAWHLARFDPTGPARQELAGSLMSSVLPNGASGPLLEPMDVLVERVGPQRVTVPAGTFDTQHFRFVLADAPDEHVWVLDDDFVMVRIRWDVTSTTYELVELER
jgi:hypothetical protein